MFTNTHNDHLQLEVVRAILRQRPELRRDLVVIATDGGHIILRGLVPTLEDCREIEALVKRVPSVTEVFCHLAICSRKTQTQEMRSHV
jgi:osmotically-inducible protein OsmY